MTPSERIERARQDLQQAQADLVNILKSDRSRRRGGVVRMLHEVRGMLHPAYPFASQAGQDQVIDRLFNGKTGGVFVDIGAYDGVTGSNTLYFEKWRGWTGVLVEPVEIMRKRAVKMRKARSLPYAIADQDGEASFLAVTAGYTQMSGLIEQYDPRMLDRVRADPRHSEQRITVQTRTIASIFDETGLREADFVSLDIEGGELAALRVFPFASYKVKSWAIENNSGGPEIAQIMRKNGYDLIEFCGPDEIYALKTA